MALYRLKVIRSPDGDTAELFYVRTDELIARGTPDEVEKVLARLIREAAEEGTKLHEIAVGRGRGCEGASRPAGIRIAAGDVRRWLLPAEHAAGTTTLMVVLSIQRDPAPEARQSSAPPRRKCRGF